MTQKDIPQWIKDHQVFFEWWKKHRHSGYVEDKQGRAHWGDEPWVAYKCDRYRVEFSIDTGTPYESKHQYSAAEMEQWAQEQKEMEDYVRGDYRCVGIDVFLETLRAASKKLANKFSVAAEFEKENAELTAAQRTAQLMEVENKFGSGVEGWEKAKEGYNELAEKKRKADEWSYMAAQMCSANA